jgi:hypothetical protein
MKQKYENSEKLVEHTEAIKGRLVLICYNEQEIP